MDSEFKRNIREYTDEEHDPEVLKTVGLVDEEEENQDN